MKTNKPPADQPRTEQVSKGDKKPTAEEQDISLALLCDMAWRIADARRVLPADMSAWCQCVAEAHGLIEAAIVVRQLQEAGAKFQSHIDYANKEICSLLTEDEYLERRVPFERGCLLITEAEKKEIAVALFQRACERGYLGVSPEQLKEIELNGFDVDDLPDMRATFVRVPKPSLRKNSAEHTE